MGLAAGGTRWAVFLGASAALIVSSALAVLAGGASALVAGVYLWATRRGMKAPAGLPAFVFIAGAASLALLGYAARHGGHIRHTEIAGAHHHGGPAGPGFFTRHDDRL